MLTTMKAKIVKIAFILFFLVLNLSGIHSFPEKSIWRESVHSSKILRMTKSLKSGSKVHAKIHCDESMKLQVKWVLLHTPCLDILQSFNASKWLIDSQKNNYLMGKISYKMGSIERECQPLKPIFLEPSPTIYGYPASSASSSSADLSVPESSVDLLSKTWATGDHMLVLQISSSQFTDKSDVRVEVEMVNPDGDYLSIVEYPLLPFNGVLCILYLIMLIIWLTLAICYRQDLMRIQYCIGIVLLLGLWEHLTWFAIYETLNKNGQAAPSGAIFAELIACTKRTLARILVLIACLGYGVTKPRLGAIWFRRCMAIGVFYFILVTTEGLTRLVHARFVITRFRLATLLPLLCLDVIIMWWIFIYLARTMRETRMRHNVVKHRLYRNFSYVLVAISVASVLFMLWSVFVFKNTACIESWRHLWIDAAFWQFLFVIILSVIIILWRPSGANREYAYSPLLDFNPLASGEDDDEDMEEVLLDRLDQENSNVTHVRSRSTEEADEAKEVTPQVTLHPGQKPIPASLVERIGIEAATGPSDPAPVWKVE